MESARNAYLSSAMGQLTLQSQVLMAKTIRLVGRPSRAIEEHRDLIELIAARDDKAAQALMERHILSALEDILRFGISKPDESPEDAPGRDEDLQRRRFGLGGCVPCGVPVGSERDGRQEQISDVQWLQFVILAQGARARQVLARQQPQMELQALCARLQLRQPVMAPWP